jgi:hypothetical protein
MNLAILRLNGALYELADYGIKTLDFQIDEPSPRVLTDTAEGRDGNIELSATYDARALRASFFMTSVDGDDFVLLRNDLFRIFANREQFYLIDRRENGKRWLVRSNGFSIEQIKANKGRFNVDFTAANPFAESIGTTLDAQTFDADLWQLGQGLTTDAVPYTYATSTFSVFNAGDIAIDPRFVPLVITFKGASTNLTITNNTTDETWLYAGTTTESDVINLDGVKSRKNGASIFRDTNRSVISLAQGWNDFTVTGASGEFTVTFDFRFYYL